MEIKAQLMKPYTEPQRIEFIVEQNHRNGYEIVETETSLDAMGKSNEEILVDLKQSKLNENTDKAKKAIEDGYVIFKDAQFETNSQTVGDLTATMLMLGDEDIYYWLSKDDKVVELNKLDFIELGKLIAGYKNSVWNIKYIYYKEQIEQATEIYELDDIIIDYTSNTEPEPVTPEVTPEELPEELPEEVQENEDVNNG